MTKSKPVHAPIEGFPVEEGEITVGGMPVSRLARRVGSTPFFAYSRDLITQRIAKMRRELPDGLHIHYAMKANPMPAVVQHIAPQVDGLDVASVGEMQVALNAGMAPELISFAGPGKTNEELSAAIAAGVVINMESAGEMRRIAAEAKVQGLCPKVAVRVNPDFELKSSGMKMGGGPKQFGIDAEQMPEVLAELANLELDFVGFHIFSGSQNLKIEALREAQEKTIDLALRLSDLAPKEPKFVNIGGGLGIPYFPGDVPLDLPAVGAGLAEILPKINKELPNTDIVIELGRYFVGEAGVYVAKVVDRKVSRGQVFLVTDGGLHHQLAASGNFGQIIRKNYPVAIGNKMSAPQEEVADIVGCLCTPLDRLGDKMELPKADVGDLVVVFQSGAYGFSASPTAFLGHPVPAEVLV